MHLTSMCTYYCVYTIIYRFVTRLQIAEDLLRRHMRCIGCSMVSAMLVSSARGVSMA